MALVTKDDLQAAAANLHTRAEKQRGTSEKHARAKSLSQTIHDSVWKWDELGLHTPENVRGYLESFGVVVKRTRTSGGAYYLDLESCPIAGDQGGTSVSVIVNGDGSVGYKNWHDSGADLHLPDLIDYCEPGYKQRNHKPETWTSPATLAPPPGADKADEVRTLWNACRYTLADFTAAPPPPTEMLIQGIQETALLGTISGAPGSLKTMLLLVWLAHVAAGIDWNGKSVKQGTVVVIDVDNGKRRMHRRLYAIAKSLGITDAPIISYVFPPLLLSKRESIDALEAMIRREGAVWVGIDTLVNAAGIDDENAAAQFQVPLYNLRRVVDATDASITLIHHPPKGGKGLRGSGAILGAVDLALEVTRPEQKSGVITVESFKSRDDDIAPFTLEWLPERDIVGGLVGGAFAAVDAAVTMDTDLHRRLVEELTEGGDGGLNQLVRRIGCNKNNLAALLKNLVNLKVITATKGKKNAITYALKSAGK